mmetsp:Transcript_14127/g.17123  ORF Transcript_14127/g.17123 Transcript_14127/m.17123 type:complete len:291 (-) Transcript_14127:246-1118(-)|eukprot:CAMPEP_0197855974 /NCGR_PEP_ID=MMETSP1438-20131217/27613_1 /TAXON_ID=1461541 /ORGANISM="Pterosperma sp., Strain CCMP1384" /LENGTH=290 /DNA_ID=CAMNT_0043471257 /DNA_START=130 /DNA_END=1002 /DNA_ORIENTATION=-
MNPTDRRLQAIARHLNASEAPLSGVDIQETSFRAGFDNILTEVKDGIATLTLNRPKALNALNFAVMADVITALKRFDDDPEVRCIVMTGAGRAFAAGADIKEMEKQELAATYMANKSHGWEQMYATKKPLIGAVNGFAFGGGCEVAMMCDILIASENAVFGQPEIKLGILPGMGGTQRLTHAVGKSRAMEMILTGNPIKAVEAEKIGLVSKVVPADQLMDVTYKMAKQIASYSIPATMMAKESVKQAYEATLGEGLHFERRMFHAAFGLKDQKEGMNAFINKRKPKFTDE